MKEPISTWTGLVYPLAGGLLISLSPTLGAAVLAVALLFLGLGTFAFHNWETGVTQDFDHAGMNAVTAVLATLAVGAPWYLAAVAGVASAVVLEYMMDLPNRHIVGIFIWLTMMALFGAGAWPWLIAGFVSMGAGFVLWQFKSDLFHGLWHVLTAAGFVLFYLGI